MEEGTTQISSLQRTIIDLQYKLQCERETCLRDKSDMQRQLDETKQTHLRDQHRIAELQAEVSAQFPRQMIYLVMLFQTKSRRYLLNISVEEAPRVVKCRRRWW